MTAEQAVDDSQSDRTAGARLDKAFERETDTGTNVEERAMERAKVVGPYRTLIETVGDCHPRRHADRRVALIESPRANRADRRMMQPFSFVLAPDRVFSLTTTNSHEIEWIGEICAPLTLLYAIS